MIRIVKVLILSDIHDHVEQLRRVIGQTQGKVEAAVFCGDLCAPFTATVLAKVQVPTYACLGNGDEDHLAMRLKGGDSVRWTPLSQEYGEVELGGRRIAFCHYPKLAELLAQSGDYDAVFHGHTHVARNEKHRDCYLVNPGPVCGLVRGEYQIASYAVYETQSNRIEVKKI